MLVPVRLAALLAAAARSGSVAAQQTRVALVEHFGFAAFLRLRRLLAGGHGLGRAVAVGSLG